MLSGEKTVTPESTKLIEALLSALTRKDDSPPIREVSRAKVVTTINSAFFMGSLHLHKYFDSDLALPGEQHGSLSGTA